MGVGGVGRCTLVKRDHEHPGNPLKSRRELLGHAIPLRIGLYPPDPLLPL
jgi:hypothetical protein